MKTKFGTVIASVFILVAFLLTAGAGPSFAQGKGQGKKEKEEAKEAKKVNKEADKLAKTADKASKGLGRDVVFCILAAHTTEVGTAQELKDKFTSLEDVPFGQFVAAVIMADRLDQSLDAILTLLGEGKSLGQIAKEFDVNMGELRRGFGEFRSELARSMTNPPTRDCFETEG